MLKYLPQTKLPTVKLRKPTRREFLGGSIASLFLLKTSSIQRERPTRFSYTNLESQIQDYVNNWINPSINSRDVNRTGWLV